MSETPPQPIDASTRYCAVFGHPVRHSASPAMQNAGIQALGLNWRYLACDVNPTRLREALVGAREMGFIGLNLTVPHKILALDLVDVIDPAAKRWGAVNTVRFEGRSGSGGWQPVATFDNDLPAEVRSVGFNTDADAIIRSIREDLGLELQGKRVALLGAGGAGRAAALRIADEQPSELFLINRTRSKAEALADEIKSTYPQLHVATDPPVSRLDLLVNATSLGLRTDDPLPLNSDWLRAHVPGAVYDMIYRPAQTSLLKLAGELNCRTANGIGMLLHQGADALQLWTGQPAPRSIMRHALEEHIYG